MKVIGVGSGPNMTRINDWDTDGMTVVGVNNVWRGTDKWDHLIFAGDYPLKHDIKKVRPEQELHSRDLNKDFVTSYCAMSGMNFAEARIWCGMPIYFNLTYWSMHYLKPEVIGFIGFDMNYTPKEDGSTAFYGKGIDMQLRGIPDPLYQVQTMYKNDPNTMDILFDRLEGKRKEHGVKFFNLSDDPESILPWEKITFDEFKEV